MAPLLCMESSRRAPIIRAESGRLLLTAQTMTGLRTVDLSELVSVRLFSMPGRFGPGVVMLIVTDIHGVRIGLTSGESWHALREALSAKAGTRTSAPKVSRRAERLIYGGGLSVWMDALLPLFLGAVLLAGIIAVAAYVATS